MQLVYTILLFCWLPGLLAQSTLEHEILQQDSLFWRAYNDYDLAAFAGYLAEDLEFYHDKGGLTRTRDSLVAAFGRRLCATGSNQVERRVVEGSVALYPISDYGAYLRGTHTFHTMVDGKEVGGVEEAQFAHLWTREDGRWVMSRVVSYDHHPQGSPTATEVIQVDEVILATYTGAYEAPQTGKVTVSMQDGRLQLQSGDMKFLLMPISTTTFGVADRPLTFEFVPGKDEHAHSIKVYENGTLVEEAIRME